MQWQIPTLWPNPGWTTMWNCANIRQRNALHESSPAISKLESSYGSYLFMNLPHEYANASHVTPAGRNIRQSKCIHYVTHAHDVRINYANALLISDFANNSQIPFQSGELNRTPACFPSPSTMSESCLPFVSECLSLCISQVKPVFFIEDLMFTF